MCRLGERVTEIKRACYESLISSTPVVSNKVPVL